MKKICVYCASSSAVPKVYFDAADDLGALIAQRGYALVYGGGSVGLMGALARSVHRNNGCVIGVIPKFLMEREVVYKESNELIITADMRERKKTMEDLADAFIGMPGGFGTLEEMLEIITLKQLKQHNKAIIFMNVNNYYSHLSAVFDCMFEQNFAKPVYKELYCFLNNAIDAITHIENYSSVELESKWYK
jgi:uncharacterized protein (TIGR00730 family)